MKKFRVRGMIDSDIIHIVRPIIKSTYDDELGTRDFFSTLQHCSSNLHWLAVLLLTEYILLQFLFIIL